MYSFIGHTVLTKLVDPRLCWYWARISRSMQLSLMFMISVVHRKCNTIIHVDEAAISRLGPNKQIQQSIGPTDWTPYRAYMFILRPICNPLVVNNCLYFLKSNYLKIMQ
jgi:hypothetical protein